MNVAPSSAAQARTSNAPCPAADDGASSTTMPMTATPAPHSRDALKRSRPVASARHIVTSGKVENTSAQLAAGSRASA